MSFKYNFLFRGGKLRISRSAITIESLSGDDDRSGDSGDDRGGVRRGSAIAIASSTLRTKFADASDGLKLILNNSIFLTIIF